MRFAPRPLAGRLSVSVAGTHDTTLVALSILIATAASYTALDLAGRIRASSGWACHAWLATSAVAMGGGIWSMHFVAMLAFSMPGMDVSYDVPLTALSLVVAILVTGIGLHAVSREKATPKILLFSGCFVGLGIVAMHYTGMAAMRMGAHVDYDTLWVAISVLIAVGAATVALWLAFQNTGLVQKLVAAVAMGLAISGMHYSAMQAAIFTAFGRWSRAWRREPRPDGTRGGGRGYDLPHPFPRSHRRDVRPTLRAPCRARGRRIARERGALSKPLSPHSAPLAFARWGWPHRARQ